MIDRGFSIFEHILSPQECDLLGAAVAPIIRRRAGARNLMSNPTISSLAHNSAMLALATQTLGQNAMPFRATLFDKCASSNWHVLWHQDRALPLAHRFDSGEWGPWSTKSGVAYALAPAWALEHVVALRIHIDACTDTNGPLRVLPGSHNAGVMRAAQISDAVKTVAPVPCLVGRGGVLAMRPLLLHSSSRATDDQRRRVLHIEYADRFDFGNGVRLRVT